MSNDHGNTAGWVVETTANRFETDVIERSRQLPVVVDFWAPWCAPCRMLGPVLERLAQECSGRFVLVKANTDEMPQIAAEFQVQSIPAVFGVIDGQVVDFFAGALPETHIRSWLDRLLQAGELVETESLEQTDPAGAAERYRRMLDDSPNNSVASIGLARCLVKLRRFDEARKLIERLEERGFLEPEAEQLKASLELESHQDIDLDSCRAAAEAAPDDLQARLTYAEALAGDHQYQAAMDIALTLVELDRHGVGEKARQLMVDIFRVLPGDSELVRDYRRKLAMLLF